MGCLSLPLSWLRSVGKLSSDAIAAIVTELQTQGSAEWLTVGRDKLLVFWKKPLEWASVIYDWVLRVSKVAGPDRKCVLCADHSDAFSACACVEQVVANGMQGSVCTLYELQNGTESEGAGACVCASNTLRLTSLTEGCAVVCVCGWIMSEAEFHGVDQAILLRALRVLETQGRAALFPSGDGVKFA